MPILVFLFGLLAGCLLAVIVGLIGSHRRIGFGWAFMLSVVTSVGASRCGGAHVVA